MLNVLCDDAGELMVAAVQGHVGSGPRSKLWTCVWQSCSILCKKLDQGTKKKWPELHQGGAMSDTEWQVWKSSRTCNYHTEGSNCLERPLCRGCYKIRCAWRKSRDVNLRRLWLVSCRTPQTACCSCSRSSDGRTSRFPTVSNLRT